MKNKEVKQFKILKSFSCAGSACPDTCCYGWGIKLEQQIIDMYHKNAPELLESINSTSSGHSIKKDPCTNNCVQLGKDGLCNIHRQYGAEFLSDTCYFYPKVLRNLGDIILTSQVMSCPEITRLMLSVEQPFELDEDYSGKVPYNIKDYTTAGISGDDSLAIHQFFIAMAGNAVESSSLIASRIVTLSQSMNMIAPERYLPMLEVMSDTAALRLITPDPDIHDLCNLVNSLLILLKSSSSQMKRLRLDETIATIAQKLHLEIDKETPAVLYKESELVHYFELISSLSPSTKKQFERVMKLYLQGQIVSSTFPFGGFGNNPFEKCMVVMVKFCTVRLAVLCHITEQGQMPDEKTLVRIIQSISRFYDHMGNQELTLKIYEEFGWILESRLLGLIGGV